MKMATRKPVLFAFQLFEVHQIPLRCIHLVIHLFTLPYFCLSVYPFISHSSIQLTILVWEGLGWKKWIRHRSWLKKVGLIKVGLFVKNIWDYLAENRYILRMRRNLCYNLCNICKKAIFFILWTIQCLGICSWEDSGIT